MQDKNHVDVKIKSWGNGSSTGPWIKLDLADEEDLEALKNQIGNGFHMILVPIDQGEHQEVEKEKPTVKEYLDLDGEPYSAPIPKEMENIQTGAITHISDTGKAVTTFKKEKPLSCQAHFMIQEKSFRGFVKQIFLVNLIDITDSDVWLKRVCGIVSKKELDDDDNSDEITSFKQIQAKWRKWVNR